MAGFFGIVDGAELPRVHPERFGIRVVDEQGRGVPLVELRTVNEIRCVSDNLGWIAWQEPGMMQQEIFWHVSGPGIEREADGFGFRSFRAVANPGHSAECRVRTINIAQRLGRLTGLGLYRDSELLGLPHPPQNSTAPVVAGQDSVQAAVFSGTIFWLWGDTTTARHPLGNFHTTCATTPLKAHPETGLSFDYFRDRADAKSLRRMFPTSEPGVVWMFGLFTVPDDSGRDRLFAGFSRRPGLEPAFEQGIAEFDSDLGHFVKVADVDNRNDWALPNGSAVRATTTDGDHVYFCRPFAHSRVAANLADIRDPSRYEVLRWDEKVGKWVWVRGGKPTTQQDESRLIGEGKVPRDRARYGLKDVAGAEIRLHTGSIAWNGFRNRYVLIGVQLAHENASPSLLGEVWYAESDAIAGPWRRAVRVASHPNYSFYNPVQHRFFNRDGDRTIYFEGTYTRQFSGNQTATPRYDYNQVMYRLDLTDARLEPAH